VLSRILQGLLQLDPDQGRVKVEKILDVSNIFFARGDSADDDNPATWRLNVVKLFYLSLCLSK
jgi:hypothetical protein